MRKNMEIKIFITFNCAANLLCDFSLAHITPMRDTKMPFTFTRKQIGKIWDEVLARRFEQEELFNLTKLTDSQIKPCFQHSGIFFHFFFIGCHCVPCLSIGPTNPLSDIIEVIASA